MSFEIIVVAYHSLTPIINLYKTIPLNFQIVIVDNASDVALAEWSKNKKILATLMPKIILALARHAI